MEANVLRRVRQLRKENPYQPLAMKYAVEQARREKKEYEGKYEFLNQITNGYGEESASGEVEGFHVRVRVVQDYDSRLGDDDVTGTFSHERDDDDMAIKVSISGWGNGDGANWYHPANYRRDPENMAHEGRGMSRGVRADYLRWLIEQDMRDDYSRNWYGIIAEVEYDGAEIGDSSLWGVDTIDGYDGVSYFREVAEEQIEEALAEASAWLEKNKVTKVHRCKLTDRTIDVIETALRHTKMHGGFPEFTSEDYDSVLSLMAEVRHKSSEADDE